MYEYVCTHTHVIPKSVLGELAVVTSHSGERLVPGTSHTDEHLVPGTWFLDSVLH